MSFAQTTNCLRSWSSCLSTVSWSIQAIQVRFSKFLSYHTHPSNNRLHNSLLIFHILLKYMFNPIYLFIYICLVITFLSIFSFSSSCYLRSSISHFCDKNICIVLLLFSIYIFLSRIDKIKSDFFVAILTPDKKKPEQNRYIDQNLLIIWISHLTLIKICLILFQLLYSFTVMANIKQYKWGEYKLLKLECFFVSFLQDYKTNSLSFKGEF